MPSAHSLLSEAQWSTLLALPILTHTMQLAPWIARYSRQYHPDLGPKVTQEPPNVVNNNSGRG